MVAAAGFAASELFSLFRKHGFAEIFPPDLSSERGHAVTAVPGGPLFASEPAQWPLFSKKR